jgi:O-antigen/teichoic acid export membrane protein
MTATVGGSVAAFGLFIAGDHRPAGIGLGEIVAVAFGTVLSAFVDAGYAMLLASGRVREQATLTATGPWLYAALLIAISLTSGLTIRSAALAWVVSQGVAAVGLLIISLRGTALGPPSGALLRESIAFGIQVWVGSLSSLLNARLDQLLVGVLASTRSLGAYAVAVNAAEIVFYVPTAFALALLSTIARDAPDLRALRVTLAFRAALLVTAALSIVGALLGPLVVPLVFGAQYGESVLPYVLLLPGGLGFTATGILSPALLLWSSPRLASVGPGIALVVGVVLDFQLIPVHGVAGAALAATTALLAGGAAALISYHVRTRAPWKSFVPGPADLRLLGSSAGSLLRSLLRVAR